MERKYQYMLLDRMKQDCEYFINFSHCEKYLWSNDVKSHIRDMKELWDSFSKDEKPEWLSYEDILEYEKKMLDNLK